jgi:hypothetical protein
MTTDFEAELRSSLAAIPAIPRTGLAEAAAEGHRHHQRRRRRITLTATGCTVAAAGVAAGLILASTPAPAPLTTAYVVDHVTSALSSANAITYTVQQISGPSSDDPNDPSAGSTISTWSYGDQNRTLITNASGDPGVDESVTKHGNRSTVVYVFYKSRTWLSGLVVIASAPPTSQATGCTSESLRFPFPDTQTLSSPVAWSTLIRTGLQCGVFTVTSQPDDKVIELQDNQAEVLTTLWVNPQTYLPVQLVTEPRPQDHSLASKITFHWLPPTQKNLADLTVPIPPGFTQVHFGFAAKK